MREKLKMNKPRTTTCRIQHASTRKFHAHVRRTHWTFFLKAVIAVVKYAPIFSQNQSVIGSQRIHACIHILLFSLYHHIHSTHHISGLARVSQQHTCRRTQKTAASGGPCTRLRDSWSRGSWPHKSLSLKVGTQSHSASDRHEAEHPGRQVAPAIVAAPRAA